MRCRRDSGGLWIGRGRPNRSIDPLIGLSSSSSSLKARSCSTRNDPLGEQSLGRAVRSLPSAAAASWISTAAYLLSRADWAARSRGGVAARAWAATNAQIKPCKAWIESVEGPDPIVVGACRGASRQIPRQEEGQEQKKRSLRWIDRRGRINCGNAIRERRSRTLNRSLGSVCFGGSARLFCSLGVRAGVPNQIGPTSAQIRHGQRPSATVGAAIALPTVHGVDTGRVLLIEAVALGCSGPCVPLVRRRQPAPGAIYCAPSWGQKDLSPVAEAIGLRPTQPRQAPPRRFDSMDGVVPGRDRQGPQRASRSVRGSG